MRKCIGYTIVRSGGGYEDLIGLVTGLVEYGWEPVGGIAFSADEWVFQAMAKYEEVTE